MQTTNKDNEQPEQQETEQQLKPMTAREVTRKLIEAAKAKNGGKLGGNGNYDRRKFRRL